MRFYYCYCFYCCSYCCSFCCFCYCCFYRYYIVICMLLSVLVLFLLGWCLIHRRDVLSVRLLASVPSVFILSVCFVRLFCLPISGGVSQEIFVSPPMLLCQVSLSVFYFCVVCYVCHTLTLILLAKFTLYIDVPILLRRLRDLRRRPRPRRAPLIWDSNSNSTTTSPPLAFVSFVSLYLFLIFCLYSFPSLPFSLSIPLSFSFFSSISFLLFPFSPSFSSFVFLSLFFPLVSFVCYPFFYDI